MKWLREPFFQQTLPIRVTFLVGIWVATWAQNKRSEEISKRIDDLAKGFDRSFGDLSKRADQRLDDMANRTDQRLVEMANRMDQRFAEMTKRIGDLGRHGDQRFDSVDARLIRIEDLLQNHETRIAVLEDRTSPITRAR